MKYIKIILLLSLLQITICNKNEAFLSQSCKLLQEMYKDSEQYMRKIYKINLNDKEGFIKLLYEAEEVFYDLTYPKILKKIHNFEKLYQERVNAILKHLGIEFGLFNRNWDLMILKFIALTSQMQNEQEQLCLLHSQTSLLIYSLFNANVFYSDKLEYQKFLMSYFLRYLSKEYDQMEKYDFYEKNFHQGISGIYIKTEKQIQKLKKSLLKFEGQKVSQSQLKKINELLEKGEKYLENSFKKIIHASYTNIQEEFFGTFMFYRDIVKKKQNLQDIQQNNLKNNKRGSLKNANIIKNFQNFQIFDDVEFLLEPNQQDKFINHLQNLMDTIVSYGDFIIRKVRINKSQNKIDIKTNSDQLINYEQKLFGILLKKDYENHLSDYEFQQVHNQAIINLHKRYLMLSYQSFLRWKFDLKNLRTKFNTKGRVLMFSKYEIEQIFFNLQQQINDFIGLNKQPSNWGKDLLYNDKAIKNNGLNEDDIRKIFQQKLDSILIQQKSMKNKFQIYKHTTNYPHYFKTFLFYNQRILTDKPLNEIMDIQKDILNEQKKQNKTNGLKITNVLIENYTDSFFFLSKVCKQIKNENPETLLKTILLKLHKAGGLIEYSASVIINKIFTFLDDIIFQLLTGALKKVILQAVQNHCREKGEPIPQKFLEIDLFQRVDAWLLPVTKWFRENEIIDDEVLKEVEEYQKIMPDKLHKKLLRFRVENFDYDKRYFESNDKIFNDLVVSNFLTQKLQHEKTEKPNYI